MPADALPDLTRAGKDLGACMERTHPLSTQAVKGPDNHSSHLSQATIFAMRLKADLNTLVRTAASAGGPICTVISLHGSRRLHGQTSQCSICLDYTDFKAITR